MRVTIDATPIGLETLDTGGVYRYVYQLVEALARLGGEERYRLFFNFVRGRHRRVLKRNLEALALPSRFDYRVCRVPPRWWYEAGVPVELMAGIADVFHGCFDRLPRQWAGRAVVTIHDVRYLEEDLEQVDPELRASLAGHPEWEADFDHRTRLFAELRAGIGRTLERASRVITVSGFSRQRLMARTGISGERVDVVYNGVSRHFAPVPRERRREVLAGWGLDAPYLLYVGKLDPLKNLGRLLAAYARAFPATGPELVLVGPRNWYYAELQRQARALDVTGRVRFLPFVDDARLPALYSGALALALPSLYEGFGLPALEAMACGTPAIVSDRGALPEVVGDAGLKVDALSVQAIAGALAEMVEAPALRRRLATAGRERAGGFSWDRCARETRAVYRRAVEAT